MRLERSGIRSLGYPPDKGKVQNLTTTLQWRERHRVQSEGPGGRRRIQDLTMTKINGWCAGHARDAL